MAELNDGDAPFVIPEARLPPGFAESIERVPNVPAEPRPAATAVLMRDAARGPEVLLLERHRASGFVPGAYVFPGGRVDAADARTDWPVQNLQTPDSVLAPPAEYWVAAVREIFEETGVLLARGHDGAWAREACADPELEDWREHLLTEQATLQELLDARSLRLEPREVVYIAHWITPLVEPRRYDTRFFLARLPEHREVRVDAREMVNAVWLSPRAALERFEAGTLPMVFPTVKTLQTLQVYQSVDAALAAFREQEIRPILPRLVRTGDGVGIVLDQDD